MSRKQRRLTLILAGLIVLGFAVGLITYALRDSLVFFHSPTEIMSKNNLDGKKLRLGGLVAKDSIKKEGLNVTFTITDGNKAILVTYTGLLPDLFREGQGVIAEGKLVSGTFVAQTILAKHDENYMPREVMDALKKQGHWQGEKQGEKK